MVKKHNGWIVTNFGTPVYPTFSTLRRVSISKWSHADPDKWRDWQQAGRVKCEKCVLVLDRHAPTEGK